MGGLVNINTADQRALESLPGIGPALAGRIVAYREQNGAFTEPSDLMDVSGIGPATFEEIRKLITTQ
jgi:competence protein ComEA